MTDGRVVARHGCGTSVPQVTDVDVEDIGVCLSFGGDPH